MKPILKKEFADLVPVSMSTLLSWLQQYRVELQKLGQPVRGNTLNYLSALYICRQQVIDPREIYPNVTDEELSKAYNKINNKIYETATKNQEDVKLGRPQDR